MAITGIDRITYLANDLAKCRQFFLDWGLKLVREDRLRLTFATLNGCEVLVEDTAGGASSFEPAPTLQSVIWSAESEDDLRRLRPVFEPRPGFAIDGGIMSCIDPNGLRVGLRVSRKRAVEARGVAANTWDNASRVDTPAPIYTRAEPIEVGHVVFFTDDLQLTTAFYQELGFIVSDRYPGRGNFMRCTPRGGHHDLFLLQPPDGKKGLNHVAFTVRDIYEVFGGGLHMARCGWETQLGPGRHPISSAFFWYFKNPAGALAEYYADEDVLTEKWQPRDFEPGPTVFAEWAVAGGLDGNTRRQKSAAPAVDSKFLTERR